jgi:hypothetical protein
MILLCTPVSLMAVLSVSTAVGIYRLSSCSSLCAATPEPVKQNVTYPREHIFTRSIVEDDSLVDEYERSMEQAQRCMNLRDKVANLQRSDCTIEQTHGRSSTDPTKSSLICYR